MAGQQDRALGEGLKSGDIILGGSSRDQTNIARGDVLHADYGPSAGYRCVV